MGQPQPPATPVITLAALGPGGTPRRGSGVAGGERCGNERLSLVVNVQCAAPPFVLLLLLVRLDSLWRRVSPHCCYPRHKNQTDDCLGCMYYFIRLTTSAIPAAPIPSCTYSCALMGQLFGIWLMIDYPWLFTIIR